MKSLRKTLHESRLKTHQQVRSWLQPKMGAIGTKYRLAARIRLANAWAIKHPKKTFAYVVSSLLFLLVGNLWISGTKTDPSNELSESNISMLPTWNRFSVASIPYRQTRTSRATR